MRAPRGTVNIFGGKRRRGGWLMMMRLKLSRRHTHYALLWKYVTEKDDARKYHEYTQIALIICVNNWSCCVSLSAGLEKSLATECGWVRIGNIGNTLTLPTQTRDTATHGLVVVASWSFTFLIHTRVTFAMRQYMTRYRVALIHRYFRET